MSSFKSRHLFLRASKGPNALSFSVESKPSVFAARRETSSDSGDFVADPYLSQPTVFFSR